MMEFNYIRIHTDTLSPKREHNSAGWDMFADHDADVVPGLPTLIKTGIKIQFMSSGWVAFLKEKSGLALKRNVEVHGGVIDADYRGEIGVIVKCSNGISIKRGDPIAQMVFLKLPDTVMMQESVNEDPTSRMADGYGSTAGL